MQRVQAVARVRRPRSSLNPFSSGARRGRTTLACACTDARLRAARPRRELRWLGTSELRKRPTAADCWPRTAAGAGTRVSSSWSSPPRPPPPPAEEEEEEEGLFNSEVFARLGLETFNDSELRARYRELDSDADGALSRRASRGATRETVSRDTASTARRTPRFVRLCKSVRARRHYRRRG